MSLSIAGTGSALPARALENEELTSFFDTSDEWIRTRTGIHRRHVLQNEETVTALALKAARNALENAGATAADVDYILCPTLGGDFITPSLASMVQAGLGATCPALDLNAACTGFLYALDVAAGLLNKAGVQNVLIVAAEGLSRLVDWDDRSTAILFGDGAGAVLVTRGQNLLYTHLTSQGLAQPLHIEHPPGKFPGTQPSGSGYIKMDGAEIYKFAVNAITEGVQKALEETGVSLDDIGHMFLHQANIRIIRAACRRLGIPDEKCPTNIQEVGNLSAASIPVLLDGENRAGHLLKGQLIVFSGFGGGLTTGTAILRWGV